MLLVGGWRFENGIRRNFAKFGIFEFALARVGFLSFSWFVGLDSLSAD